MYCGHSTQCSHLVWFYIHLWYAPRCSKGLALHRAVNWLIEAVRTAVCRHLRALRHCHPVALSTHRQTVRIVKQSSSVVNTNNTAYARRCSQQPSYLYCLVLTLSRASVASTGESSCWIFSLLFIKQWRTRVGNQLGHHLQTHRTIFTFLNF